MDTHFGKADLRIPPERTQIPEMEGEKKAKPQVVDISGAASKFQ